MHRAPRVRHWDGLGICRTFIAAHGGAALGTEPNADRGSTFYVALAAAQESP